MIVTCRLSMSNESRPPMSRERFKLVSIAHASNIDIYIVLSRVLCSLIDLRGYM